MRSARVGVSKLVGKYWRTANETLFLLRQPIRASSAFSMDLGLIEGDANCCNSLHVTMTASFSENVLKIFSTDRVFSLDD